MIKRIIVLTLSLLLIAGYGYAQFYSWRYLSSADCQAETTGKLRDLCFDTVKEVLYKCVPAAGDCDTAGEWKLCGSTAYDDIGDPDAAGSISFDDGETLEYDGAWVMRRQLLLVLMLKI